ncbi:MAG TPA: histidine phosphatase family protein [Pseudonocardiaceae bacterium]
MAEVVVLRHGETGWSRSGQHTGRTDIALTEHGRAQARRLGQLLEGRTFALVLTSPLSRAVQTCALAGYGDVAVVCEDLREWDYGRYEGRTTAEIRTERPDWTIWTHSVPNGETAASVGERADRVVAIARAAGGDVALFGHGHILRVLAARWCGLTPTAGRIVGLDPATVSVLGYEHETSIIRRWNQADPVPGVS